MKTQANKTITATATDKTVATVTKGDTTTTTATTTKVVLTETIRPVSVIRELLAYGENGSVMFAKRPEGVQAPTADELIGVAADDAALQESATMRAANTVRLCRMLPAVVITPAVMDGDKVKTPAVTRSAFTYACDKLAEKCSTRSTFNNIFGMIEIADLVENTPELSGQSPFKVKEALGYLRKVGAIQEADAAKGIKPSVKLALVDAPVAAVLKGEVKGGVNAIREPLAEAKAKRPDLFPPKGKGATPAPAIVTTPVDPVAPVLAKLKMAISEWETLAGQGKAKDLRETCKAEVEKLAALAGFKVTALE